MKTPVPQPPDGLSLTTSQVRAHALSVGIREDMLTSYRKAGLLARAVGQRSPARALAQLEGIASAQSWTHSLERTRHALWWGGVPIEDFDLLREQWTRHVDEQSELAQHVASLSEDERDAEAQQLADFLARDRRVPFPRHQITAEADRESFAALMVGLVARDPQTVVFTEEVGDLVQADPEGELLLQAIRGGLAEALDDDQPMTLGELLSRGFRADEFPDAGVWMTLVACGWMPPPATMHDAMATMSEDRATRTRDFIKHWLPGPRFGVDLERSPDVAAILVLAFDRAIEAMPDLVEADAG
jgi:hypothetical protein